MDELAAVPEEHEVDPMILNVNLDHLTTGEIEMIEEIMEGPITWLGDENRPKGKGLRGLAYVMGLRKNPDYTMEEARNMRVSLVDEEIPPTESGDSSPEST